MGVTLGCGASLEAAGSMSAGPAAHGDVSSRLARESEERASPGAADADGVAEVEELLRYLPRSVWANGAVPGLEHHTLRTATAKYAGSSSQIHSKYVIFC